MDGIGVSPDPADPEKTFRVSPSAASPICWQKDNLHLRVKAKKFRNLNLKYKGRLEIVNNLLI